LAKRALPTQKALHGRPRASDWFLCKLLFLYFDAMRLEPGRREVVGMGGAFSGKLIPNGFHLTREQIDC
jgi:hypothetical protein